MAEIEKNTQIHHQGVAYHQGCAVYHPLKKYTALYRSEEFKHEDGSYSNEGIYVFGGLS
jgi:hypothetical protein